MSTSSTTPLRRLRQTGASLLLLTAAACASPPPTASVSLPLIPAGEARVWFYRRRSGRAIPHRRRQLWQGLRPGQGRRPRHRTGAVRQGRVVAILDPGWRQRRLWRGCRRRLLARRLLRLADPARGRPSRCGTQRVLRQLIAGWSRTLPAAAQEVLVECFCKIEAPQESLISYAGPKVRKGST